MSWLVILITATAFGAINYVRGRGMIPRAGHVVASVAWGIVATLAAWSLGYSGAYMAAIGIITFAGMLIWMVGIGLGGGWGLYFSSWTWVWNPNDSEVKLIDWIGLKLVPFKQMSPHWTNGLRGTICMSLRGLYILPLFFMLGMLPLGVIVGLAQGLVYGSMRWLAPNAGTLYAEPVYGFLVGAATAYTLTVGF